MDDKLLADITAAIVREVAPAQVILFGSQANRGARAGSDVDLLIVEDQPFSRQHSRQAELGRLRQALRSFHVPLDLLLFSQEEVGRWRRSLNHVIGRALREGVTLYARS